MSLAEKARENLASGALLLINGHVNAAASRLYYSLFQAAAHVLETKHAMTPKKFDLKADHWQHGMICNNASLVRGNNGDRKLYELFRSLRVQADYQPLHVERERVETRLAKVRELVEEVTS